MLSQMKFKNHFSIIIFESAQFGESSVQVFLSKNKNFKSRVKIVGICFSYTTNLGTEITGK